MNPRHVAVLLGLSLILPASQFNAFGAFEKDLRNPTAISLDLIEQCINTMTCSAQVYTGTTIKFTGVLTDEEGNTLQDKPVNIVALIPSPELVVLTSTTTDFDGIFEAEWVAKLSTQKTAFQDVTKQFQTESVTVFAEFPGDDELAPSRSNKITMSVTVNTVHTVANSDKTLYNENDSVIIFVSFYDSADQFIDPDSVYATLNNQPVELEKKKEGSYTLTITEIAKKHQQLIVVPSKEGFNLSTAYLTIIVSGLR
jgi:hypothetical protein